MKRFDACCHLAHDAFAGDVAAVIARAYAAGVVGMHIPGVDPASFTRARSLGEGIVHGVGLHPWWVATASEADIEVGLRAMRAAIERDDVRSIGEIGLDRARDRGSIEAQTRALVAQLAIARAQALPIVLHVVDAHGLVLELLEREGPFEGMVHGFSGSAEVAARYVALGLHVSFGPAITRAHVRRAREAARVVPDTRLLVETDAPDQSVDSGRGEPAMLGVVIDALASLRGATHAHVAAATYENALGLFAPRSRRRADGAAGC